MQIDKNTLIHALRLSIAATLAALVGERLNVGHMYWLMFTTVMVMQGEIGSSIKRSIERTVGTLIGAPLGIVILMMVGYYHGVVLMSILVVSLSLVILIIPKNYGLGVVFITVCVIIAFALLGDMAIEDTAFNRIADTIFGTIIAIIVSIVVFPRSLDKLLLKEWIDFLRDSGELYGLSIDDCLEGGDRKLSLQKRREYITKTNLLIKRANESAWELGMFGGVSNSAGFRLLIIRNSLVLVNRYLELAALTEVKMEMNDSIKASLLKCKSLIGEAFAELADGFLGKRVCNIDIEALREGVQAEVESIISEIENSKIKEERWREFVKVAAFYEQNIEIIDSIKQIKEFN